MNTKTIDQIIDKPKIISKQQWIASIIVIITAMTALMGTDLYLPAMPDMASHFHATKSQLQLTITVYLASIGLAAFFYGPLSDKIGRKPSLIIGSTTGLIGCLIILFSKNIDTLIIGRFIQGLGASAGICIATSVLVDIFPSKKQMSLISSYLSMVMTLSPLFAPTIGGYLTHYLGWRSCFIVLVILFAIIMTLHITIFKETLKEKNPNSLKLKVLMKNYLALAKDKTFLFMCICAGIALSLVMSYANIAPFIFMGTFHISPIEFGYITLIVGISNIIGKFSNKFFIQQLSLNKTMTFGMMFAILGGVYLIVISIINLQSPISILIGIFISQLAIGLIVGNAPAIALPPFRHIAGSASAMYRGSQQIVAFITSAILTALPWHNSYIMAISYMFLGFIGVILLLNLKSKS